MLFLSARLFGMSTVNHRKTELFGRHPYRGGRIIWSTIMNEDVLHHPLPRVYGNHEEKREYGSTRRTPVKRREVLDRLRCTTRVISCCIIVFEFDSAGNTEAQSSFLFYRY